MSTIRLGAGREFDLIRAALDQDAAIRAAITNGTSSGSRGGPIPAAGRIVVGAGGDCAILSADAVALSVDASVEDIHFRRDWIGPREIGNRCAAAALSDLAAAGALPIGMLVSLAVGAADVPDFALAVMAGISEVAAGNGAALLGGNMSRTTGPLTIDITVVGEPGLLVTRSGARPGDELWVTGTLGSAAAAVREWTAGRIPSAAAIKAFAHPVPRLHEARWLIERGVVTAMIDLSDGLAGDSGHLAAAGNVRILLDPGAVPVSAAAQSAAEKGEALALALAGGEDYELCFTTRPGAVAGIVAPFERRFDVPLTKVGIVVDGRGTGYTGGANGPPLTGYTHFT